MKKLLLLPFLGLLLLTSACASIVEGTTQTVTVSTDPSGATCDLRRNGATIAVVNPTPGSVTLDKSRDHVSVECRKEGYQAGAESLASGFQGMTFGNVLFGGLVGVAIDASSGAMHKYPPAIIVALPPERFGSADERDAWFAQRAARIEEEFAEAMSKLRRECLQSANDGGESCRSAVEALEKEKEARLAANETQRAATPLRI